MPTTSSPQPDSTSEELTTSPASFMPGPTPDCFFPASADIGAAATSADSMAASNTFFFNMPESPSQLVPVPVFRASPEPGGGDTAMGQGAAHSVGGQYDRHKHRAGSRAAAHAPSTGCVRRRNGSGRGAATRTLRENRAG